MALEQKFSVVGLGKLGACLAACLAAKGFKVLGVDKSSESVDRINRGLAPVLEPRLNELIRDNRHNLKATGDIRAAVQETDVTFIVVPTPSDPDGSFSTRYIREVVVEMGQAMALKDRYHLVVLVSTVLPGGTEESVVRVIERESKKRRTSDFGACYNPEFIALGNVIQGILNPELVLIGESDPAAGDRLQAIYERLLDSKPAVVRTNFSNAELAKIAINTYVTTKITFANVLAEMCERLPGGDVDVVSRALGSDSRIGSRYLKGGLGFGGPCFPRDTVAFDVLTRRIGVQTGLARETQKYNDSVVGRVVKIAQDHLAPGKTVSVAGMAYKLNTPVIEKSQGMEIAATLAASGAAVCVYDPLAFEVTLKHLGPDVRFASSLADCVQAADVLVLANPFPELRGVIPQLTADGNRERVVIDCWRMVPELRGREGITYLALGLSQDLEKGSDRGAAIVGKSV